MPNKTKIKKGISVFFLLYLRANKIRANLCIELVEVSTEKNIFNMLFHKNVFLLYSN